MNEKYEEEYWRKRPFEDRYYHMALQYIEFFEPKEMIDIGCGRGYFVHAFNYFKIPSVGYDVSKYAVQHPYGISRNRLFPSKEISKRYRPKFDLVLCFDVLEHLNLEEIEQTANLLVELSDKYILLSICMMGDPNFKLDKTHITCRSKSWWIDYFQRKGLKYIPTPKNFYFGNQILLFKRGELNGKTNS